MAGMLPGVEAARRRRFHQKSNQCYGGTCSTRRPSFCLYVSSHDFQLCSSTSSTRSHTHTVCDESKLGAEAREAKKRLDERLFQAQWRSETTRGKGKGKGREEEKEQKSGSKRLSWLKTRWRRRWKEEEECVVCLEEIKAETLMQLGCGHRFHTHCLLPWLHANNHCPCCRMQIPIPLPLPLPLPLPIM